ncbi:hypothetical protein ACWG0P_15710 [Amedibacillus sp. YH-ame6]
MEEKDIELKQKQPGDDGYLEEWLKESGKNIEAKELAFAIAEHLVGKYSKTGIEGAKEIMKFMSADELANLIKNTSEEDLSYLNDSLKLFEDSGSSSTLASFKRLVTGLFTAKDLLDTTMDAKVMMDAIQDYNSTGSTYDLINAISETMNTMGDVTGFLGPIGGYFTFYLKLGSDIIAGMKTLEAKAREKHEILMGLLEPMEDSATPEEADELLNSLSKGDMSEYYQKKQIMKIKKLLDRWLQSKGISFITTEAAIHQLYPDYIFIENDIEILTNKIKNLYYKKTTAEWRDKQDHAYVFGPDGMIDKIKQDVDDASNQNKVDPLIFDIDGDGLRPTSILEGAYFDLDGNGKKERMSWVGKGDGLLVYDRNSNGIIDNGKELFSNFTVLANGTLAKSGLQALTEFDENKDGIIDEKDSIFSKLRLWMDNGDGISEAGELKTLKELGIKSISLKTNGNIGSINGIEIRNEGTYSKDDGTTGGFGEIWTKPNYADSIEKETVEISEEVKKLPEVRSFGNLASLQQAIMKDETGRIRELIGKIISTSDVKAQETLTKELLKIMSGADNIASSSRGSYIDAKELAVIEAFTGEKYVGKDGANPNNAAAPILKETYKDIVRTYLIQIMMKGILKEYIGYFSLTENNILKVDVDRLSRYIKLDIVEGRDVEKVLAGLGYILSNKGTENNAYFKFVEQFKNTSYEDIILKSNENSMIETSGNDTYIYRKEDGNDTIYDREGINTLKFLDIDSSDLSLNMS